MLRRWNHGVRLGLVRLDYAVIKPREAQGYPNYPQIGAKKGCGQGGLEARAGARVADGSWRAGALAAQNGMLKRKAQGGCGLDVMGTVCHGNCLALAGRQEVWVEYEDNKIGVFSIQKVFNLSLDRFLTNRNEICVSLSTGVSQGQCREMTKEKAGDGCKKMNNPTERFYFQMLFQSQNTPQGRHRNEGIRVRTGKAP